MRSFNIAVTLSALMLQYATLSYAKINSLELSHDYVDLEHILGDLYHPATNSIRKGGDTTNTTSQRHLAESNNVSIEKRTMKTFSIFSGAVTSTVISGVNNLPGDKLIVESALFTRSGKTLGSMNGACVYTRQSNNNAYLSEICTLTLTLNNSAGLQIGSLSLQGMSNGFERQLNDYFAVTGGSGCFASAAGSVLLDFSSSSSIYQACWYFTLYEYWVHPYSSL